MEWKNAAESYRDETEARLNISIDKLCTYGISPLDDALIAICKKELVVIGADSGVGKTEIALQIVLHNVKRQKRIALFHLEGGEEEAMSRLKWNAITQMYYRNPFGIEMNYQKWRLNVDQDPRLLDIESQIYEEFKTYVDYLYLYASNTLTIDSFTQSLLGFHSLEISENPYAITNNFDLDLIVIDHLQYFSLTQGEYEIAEITRILREVKTITEKTGIPVLMISHLRKKTKDRGIPNQEDFYGSSNIPKIATTAITIASDGDNADFANGIYPTYFRVCKSRIGIRPNFVIAINYDLAQRLYSTSYNIHRLNGEGYVCVNPLKPQELPDWAKGAR